MTVYVYNSFLCKNPFVFFVKFEQTILLSILVQFGIFYCNPIFVSSNGLDIFPACS